MATKKVITCILFILLFFIGCNKDPQNEISINHDNSTCGISEPLQNIPWLKAYCIELLNTYSATISIYKNNSSDVNYIVIDTYSKDEPDRSPSTFHTSSIYTCAGERLMFQSTEGPTPKGWEAFFKENTFVAKIWEVKKL